MSAEAIGGIDGVDKLSSQELKSLQELSKLDNSQLKDKLGADNLSVLKSNLQKEKSSYINRSDVESSKKWVGSMIDTIINNIGEIVVVEETVEPVVIDKPIEEQKTVKAHVDDSNGDTEVNTNNEKEQVEIEELTPQLLKEFGLESDEKELTELNEELTKYGLPGGVARLLEGYSDYIEQNLDGISDSTIVNKIKQSIGIRTLNIGNSMDEVQTRIDNLGENDVKENFRWVVNGKIEDNFAEINNKILPSALLLSKYVENNGNDIFMQKAGENLDIPDWAGTKNEYIESKIDEIKEMFDADLDGNGEFDEIGLETFNQNHTLQLDRERDKAIFEGIGAKQSDIGSINILNEEDKQIEKDAMLWFMGAIAGHIAIEVGPVAMGSVLPGVGNAIGVAVGTVVGAGIDVVDVFSDRETLMEMLQSAGAVPEEYRMDKTWVDNILAGIGLLPGMTPLLKGKKILSMMSKFGFNNSDLVKATEKALPYITNGGDTGKSIDKGVTGSSKGTDYIKGFDINDLPDDEKLRILKEINANVSDKMEGINGFTKLDINSPEYGEVMKEFSKLQESIIELEKGINSKLDESIDNFALEYNKLSDVAKETENAKELNQLPILADELKNVDNLGDLNVVNNKIDNINKIFESILNIPTKMREYIQNLVKLLNEKVGVSKLKIESKVTEKTIEPEQIKIGNDVEIDNSDDILKAAEQASEILSGKIEGVDNIEDLLTLISKEGKIGKYSSNNLIIYINKFMEGKGNIKEITRTNGLRDKVLRLKLAELDKADEVERLYKLLSNKIDGVDNIEDLLTLVSKEGKIGIYNSEELVSLINGYMKGEVDINAITRTNGLRDKVIALKDLLKKSEIDDEVVDILSDLKLRQLELENERKALLDGLSLDEKRKVRKTPEYILNHKEKQKVEEKVNKMERA